MAQLSTLPTFGGVGKSQTLNNHMKPHSLKHRNPKLRLDYLEEREYEVCAEGIAVRTLPDERSPRTGALLGDSLGLGGVFCAFGFV